jgi:hypothetical protein
MLDKLKVQGRSAISIEPLSGDRLIQTTENFSKFSIDKLTFEI